MDLNLTDAKVIITAGASGIGWTVANAFLSEGARVAIADVDEQAVRVARQKQPALYASVCDVANREQTRQFMANAIEHLGGLDTLVNNAGSAGPTARIEDIDPHDWEQCLAVCLTSQFTCCQMAIPHLRQSHNPSIVNLSSAAGKLGFALRTPYAAAKWGVIGLTQSLAVELGGDGIRVNAILPGIVAGDRQRRVLETKAQQKGLSFSEMEAQAFSYTAIKDYVEPEQIADQILLLASERGKTISGQSVSICGHTQMLA